MESPLKALRKELKYTQSELAMLANEKQGHISEIENGYAPLGDNLIEFVKSIGIDSDEIRQNQNRYMAYVKNQLNQRALIQKVGD